jgi:hypothetical protein
MVAENDSERKEGSAGEPFLQYKTVAVLTAGEAVQLPNVINCSDWRQDGDSPVNKTIQIESTPTAVVQRLYLEVEALGTFPRFVDISMAYLSVGNGDAKQEFLCYDVMRSGDQAIVPCLLRKLGGKGAGVASELKKTADKFGKILPSWVEQAGLIRQHVELEYGVPKNGKREVTIASSIRLYRQLASEYCGSIALPPHGEPRLVPKASVALTKLGRQAPIAADEVWAQLEQVNEIVRIPEKQVTLLTGPPGSGKDVFAETIHHGSLCKKKDTFRKMAVAGVPIAEIRLALFGSRPTGQDFRRGHIAEAEGGSLFLDEFDKVHNPGFYGSLLRVLEAGTYYPEASIQEEKAKDVNWILAGADLDGNPNIPPDLWSRLTDHLALIDPVEIHGYGASLFLSFHMKETLRWAKAEGCDFLQRDRHSDRLVRALLTGSPETIDKNGRVRPSAPVESFAREFEKRARRAKASIRGLRQATFAVSRVLRDDALEMESDALGELWEGPAREKALRRAESVLAVARHRA